MNELGTFGAVISFALELEIQAVDFYSGLKVSDLTEVSGPLLKGSQKRLSRLQRIRQELVTEMILEPITGIETEKYHIELIEVPGKTEFIQEAVNLEENLRAFYIDTAPLIPMKEVQRAFTRLAGENGKRIVTLKDSYP